MKKIIIATIGIIIILLIAVTFEKQVESKLQQEQANTQNPVISVNSNNIVNLSDKGLTQIPSSVFNETNTEELNVSNNALTGSIQSQIGQLRNLKILNASNNNMTGVPAEIGQLSKLEVLDLSNNELTGLPNELGNLSNLKVLNLSGNQYSIQDLNTIRENLPSAVEIITE